MEPSICLAVILATLVPDGIYNGTLVDIRAPLVEGRGGGPPRPLLLFELVIEGLGRRPAPVVLPFWVEPKLSNDELGSRDSRLFELLVTAGLLSAFEVHFGATRAWGDRDSARDVAQFLRERLRGARVTVSVVTRNGRHGLRESVIEDVIEVRAGAARKPTGVVSEAKLLRSWRKTVASCRARLALRAGARSGSRGGQRVARDAGPRSPA